MSEPSAVERLANSGAEQIFAELQKTGRGRYSVGFHLRQAFDPTSPQLGLRTTDLGRAEEIRDGMLDLGVNWLNHVLDSLLYLAPDPKRREWVTNLLIDFRPRLEGHHAFKFINTEKVGRSCTRIKMEAASIDAWSLLNCKDATDVVRFLHNAPARVSPNTWPSPFDGYLCGVQKLCEEIGVRQPNLTHHRSVVAAVLQVREFARVFGNKSFTMLLRDQSVFGASAGVTIGSDREINSEEGKLILGVLRSVLRETKNQLKKGGEEVTTARSYRSRRPGVRSVTKGLLQPARRLSGYKVDEQISWFLDELYTCCNRKDEGRELEFGFVLGQPRMMRYWPGSQDVYLPEMTFDALMDSTYLLEPPEERVVTVPYASSRKARGGGTQGIEIMDVGAIPEQLHSGEHRGIWDGSLRPLAHLTAHYPWAVGVGVGPGSKMRVFAGGELRFIRDERGWKEYGTKLTEGDALALTAWPGAPPDYREGIKQLLGFALQFSSNVRRNSHGALILWLPEASEDDLDDCENHTSTLMREELKEERGGMPKAPWLKGRSLFSRTEAGITLDPYVARQAIRVGLADGAIVLVKPTAEVWGFRRNLEFPKDKGSVKSMQEGTKRASAQAAVAHFANVKGAIAIAVRSNGPVQIFVRDRSLPDSPVTDFQAFRPVGDIDDE